MTPTKRNLLKSTLDKASQTSIIVDFSRLINRRYAFVLERDRPLNAVRDFLLHVNKRQALRFCYGILMHFAMID